MPRTCKPNVPLVVESNHREGWLRILMTDFTYCPAIPQDDPAWQYPQLLVEKLVYLRAEPHPDALQFIGDYGVA